MLAVSGNLTFALYLYDEIQWSCSGREHAGYIVGKGKDFIILDKSINDEAKLENLDSTSNVGKPGLWVLQIDHHSGLVDLHCQDSVTGFSTIELILE